MTNKDAIEILSKDLGKYVLTEHDVAILTAIDALEERPQGDLISRESLRKEVTEKVHFMTVDGHIAYDKMLKLIDSAPPIAINCKECDGYEAGYSAGLNDANRPKGECCGSCYLCDVGNCGADMRGEKE